MSQFRSSTPPDLLSTGSLVMSQLPPSLQVIDELLAPLLLDLLGLQFLDSLDGVCRIGSPYYSRAEYCPTSLPVCIAQGSVSGQLAPVLIWDTQVLYQASGPYRTRVPIPPLDSTTLI